MASRRPVDRFGDTNLSAAQIGGSTPVGMHRNSSVGNVGSSSGRGVFDMIDYGDADHTEGEEYISKRGRSVFSGRWKNVLGGGLLCFCLLLLVILVYSNGTSRADSSRTTVGNDGSTGNDAPKRPFDQDRYIALFDRVRLASLTPPQTLEDETSVQSAALKWLVQLDDAQLSPDDPFLLHRYVLAVLYFSMHTVDPRTNTTNAWIRQGNWMSHQGYCSWDGIECIPQADTVVIGDTNDNSPDDRDSVGNPTPVRFDDNAQVVAIRIISNRLYGTIPTELEYFAGTLRVLDLQDNNVFGTFPSYIPDVLASLHTINLRENLLTGTVPKTLGDMTNLRQLHLGQNQFRGQIPYELDRLTNIRALALNDNPDLGGTIPNLAQLQRCTTLYLDRCGLSGSFPSFLVQMTNLVDLRLGFNSLSGSLPSSLENLSKIQILHLNNNKFSESIPGEIFAKTTRLVELWLQYNQLDGTIPTQIEYLADLTSLHLEFNKIGGPFPQELALLLDLQGLYLDYNRLTGSFPMNLPALVDLEHLHVDHNRMDGRIPTTLGRLYKLKTAHLNDNLFTGTVPTTIGKLSSLKSLQIQNNAGLSGEMPSEVCDLVSEERVLHVLSANCAEEGENSNGISCHCCSKCY